MIYLDNQATTQLDPSVAQAMELALSGNTFGNPSSAHSVGVRAKRALEAARRRVEALIPGLRRQAVFTSGATEANALAILGRAPKGRRKHVIVTSLEHPSVINCARELANRGCVVTTVEPSNDGLIDADEVLDQVTEQTALLSVMLVNNEVGTIQPVASIARRVRARWPRCHVHVDAVQALGLVSLDGLDVASSISISGHKMHGPKGIGALVFDESRAPRSLWFGGGQEKGIRSGTQNVAGALGLSAALEIALTNWEDRARRIEMLRDRLIDGITSHIDEASLIGHPKRRSPANAMIAVQGLTGTSIVSALDQQEILASTGSACHAGDPRPSEVLRSMGFDRKVGTVRLGLSRSTTADEIKTTIKVFTEVVESLQKGV